MHNFLIGMYGGFDKLKYTRDLRPGFFGVEACFFPDGQEVDVMVQNLREDDLGFGVHFPLIKGDRPYRDPFLISLDEEERRKAWKCFESEAAYVSEKGASYILTHFPKPALVNRSLDLNCWRFGGAGEWMFADTYPPELLKENLCSMFQGLSDISSKYNIQIVLENDAMPSILANSSLLTELFAKYDKIKVCLAIGRLHLQSILDTEFNGMKFAEMMAPYTYLIHLWNTNPSRNLSGGHYPVLPSQKPSEGWADVRAFLEIIKEHNRDVKVLFEHRSDLLSDEELDECYGWVRCILGE